MADTCRIPFEMVHEGAEDSAVRTLRRRQPGVQLHRNPGRRRQGGVPIEKAPVISQRPNILPVYPFKDAGMNLEDIKRILTESGIGLPGYYRWRSRSGCYFCSTSK